MRKKFIFVVVTAIFLSNTIVFGESITKNIEVTLNNIEILVNGQKIDKETILYNGTTYAPIRAVAEAFGKSISYDDNTKTANIYDSELKEDVSSSFIWPISKNRSIIKGYYTYTHVLTKKVMTHPGVDIQAPVGTSVLAVNDGTVIIAEESSGYGKYIVILHSTGICSLYAHLTEIEVNVDQDVKQGDIIATSGTSDLEGEVLHFEIRDEGEPVNPMDFYIK